MKSEEIVPVLFTIDDALRYTSLTRTWLYCNLHKLEVRAAGRRTLITKASLDQLVGPIALYPDDLIAIILIAVIIVVALRIHRYYELAGRQLALRPEKDRRSTSPAHAASIPRSRRRCS